jgi:ribosomal protein S18 acetylase RimI-like enzyme
MITVRPMRPDERDEVRALLTDAYEPFTTAMPPDVHVDYLASVLNTDEGRQLVAVDGDEILGAVRLYLPGDATVRLPDDCAWVRALGVRPSARGTGVGEAIMAYCVAHAGGATAMVLHTMDFMPAAVRLYERLGYRRAPELDFVAGRGSFTAVAYRLPLAPS